MMDQPLFSCAKCFKNFPQSEMSRSGQTCKACNPHHSTFKQCEYCKSDFKYHIYGTICPRCQSLKSKFGEPQPCSICQLNTAFGNALVCQRCLHYRVRFGEPRECQSCGQLCAFVKDEASRRKVEGQILCWVCTYNFKLARSREKSEHNNRRRLDSSSRHKSHHSFESQLKRSRTDEYGSLKSDTSNSVTATAASTQSQGIDSVYNEHLLTISQLQDEVKALKRQLASKDAEMLSKDRAIAELRSEMIEMKSMHEDRLLKTKAVAQMEQDRLTSVIKQLQREKASLSQGLRKRKSGTNLASQSPALRYSASSLALFNPDSPLPISSDKASKKGEKGLKQAQKSQNSGEDTGLVMKSSADRVKEDLKISHDPDGEEHIEEKSSPPSQNVPSLKAEDEVPEHKERQVFSPADFTASAEALFGTNTSSDSGSPE